MKLNTRKYLQKGRRFLVFALTFGYMVLLVAPVNASDTEVYARTLSVTGELAPTLMMVLDTSGSMNECVSSTASCSAPNRRIDALKRAMNTVLFGDVSANVTAIPGYVRMGLTRFNPDANKGGWVRYPARPLDAFVDLNPDGVVTSALLNGNQDVEQPLSGGATLNSGQLDLAIENIGNVPQYVGLQFGNVLVPKGATITSAAIEFTADSNDSSSPVWQINVEDAANPVDFSAVSVLSRNYLAVSSSYAPDSWVAGQSYRVPVNALVQEIVTRADWCGGNAMSFRMREISGLPNVYRRAYSYEGALASGNVARAPKLVLTYTIDPNASDSCIMAPFTKTLKIVDKLDDAEWIEGSSGTSASVLDHNDNDLRVAEVFSGNKRNHVGLRFRAVPVRQGALLDSATLSFTGYNAATSMPNVQVAAFQQDNLSLLCTASNSCTVPSEATLGSDLIWALPSTRIRAEDPYSLDVKSIVQPILSRSGWAENNALGFRIRSTATTTAASKLGSFYSRDAGVLSKYPTLELKGRQRITNLAELITVREDLWSVINGLVGDGGTPLGAAYAETARYMLGAAPYAVLYDPQVVTTAPVLYKSPVSAGSECSGNYMFMMSDGDPNTLANVNVNTQGFMGSSACPNTLASYVTGTGSQLNWICMYDVARYMASGSTPIQTKVKTNSVIFGPLAGDSEANMSQVAKFGTGDYFKAGDEASLVAALVKTVNSLLDVSGSISAPGVAVNQLSRLNHLDQLYYSVFDPDVNKAAWKGNVKRYRLGFQTVAGVTEAIIYDKNNVNAVDPTTSFFKSSAWSEWSPAQDGDRAMLGGAASVLPAPDNRGGGTPRKMYTYVAAYAGTPATAVNLQAIDLTNSTFNAAAKSVMGIADDSTYRNLINWLMGYDIPDFDHGLVAVDSTSGIRSQMGGALHSRPVLVNYGYSGSDATAAAANANLQDNMAYYSTMEGVFHGVDTKTGKELFSFIPKETLQRLNVVATNPTQSLPEFGLDLTWTVLREDKDSDFKITAGGSGDKVWLFGGMRMGGRNYYALDLTTRSTPKLKWALLGGTSGAFQNMGQTWSQPVLGKVRINGIAKTVLFFGGGYDDKHETAGYTAANAADSLGNQVYIVDADTGELYWWASSSGSPSLNVPDLKFSIPSELKVLDTNADGLADAVYFGDMGGQVFRLDLNNANVSASGLGVRVRLLASLGQTVTADVVNQRRFFEAPSVARLRDPTTLQTYFLVAQGSGYRSHPLDEATNDLFYVLRDNDAARSDRITPVSALQATLTVSDLAAVNPNTVTSSGVAMTGRMGWYVDLPDNGEKVMASPFIFNNEVFFTSYVPAVVGGSSCTPVVGRTKLYQMGVLNGALVDSNNDGVVDASDSVVTDNVVFGLGGEAQLVIPAPDTPGLSSACGSVVLVGTRPVCGDDITQGAFKRLRWYNKTKH